VHMNNCKCGHHGFAKLLMALGGLSALAFLYTAWSHSTLLGLDINDYFEHVVVFSLMMFGTKWCRCCCDTGCGKNCESGVCLPGKDMGMNKDKIV